MSEVKETMTNSVKEERAARDQRIIEQYRAGVLVRRIAQAEDLDASHVHYVLNAYGVEKNRRGRLPKGSTNKKAADGRPLVIIESPFRGDPVINPRYLARAIRDSIDRGEAPFASHGLYTMPGVLDDAVQAERELGMAVGHEVMRYAALVAVYIDRGITPGMVSGIERASALGRRIEYRRLG